MITQLTAENVKKLQAVNITPDGRPVVLTGENEAGKSTVLDCIWMALTGDMPDKPIREGAKKARIELTVAIDGEDTPVLVERRFTQKGSYITVKEKDGTARKSPQKLLDSLTSSLTLDPLEFSRMKPKEQREALLHAAGVDLADLQAEYKRAYEARTQANREAARKEQAAQAMPDPPEGTPDREQSANDLIAEVEAMQEKRRQAEEAKRGIDDTKKDIQTSEQEVERLKSLLEKEEAKLAELRNILEKAEVPEAPAEEDIAAKREELSAIEETNRDVRCKLDKSAATDAAKEARDAAKKAQAAVDKVLEKKEQRIREADFGVDGITVDDESVLFEGQPLEQQSSARTIEISARIAMRGNPKLRVLVIRDASLIGTRIFGRIAEIAEQNGFQMWVERFSETPGEEGIHIVEGSIAYIDGAPVTDNKDAAEKLDIDI